MFCLTLLCRGVRDARLHQVEPRKAQLHRHNCVRHMTRLAQLRRQATLNTPPHCATLPTVALIEIQNLNTSKYCQDVRHRLLPDAFGGALPTYWRYVPSGAPGAGVIHRPVIMSVTANRISSMGKERHLRRRLPHQPRSLLSRFPTRPPPRLVHHPPEPRELRALPASPRRRARRWTHDILRYYARATWTTAWTTKLGHRGKSA